MTIILLLITGRIIRYLNLRRKRHDNDRAYRDIDGDGSSCSSRGSATQGKPAHETEAGSAASKAQGCCQETEAGS